MVAVRNIESKDLEMAFEGQTYYFPSEEIVLIEPKVSEHLKELWPLAFEFDVKLPKGSAVGKVKVVKTKSYLRPVPPPTEDMRVTRAGLQENTFNPEDGTEGPEFYGAGIEKDTV